MNGLALTPHRTFETTHPWLQFKADLRKAPVELWMVLGECQSKCEHIAGVPLQPTVAQRLHLLYLAKGVLATTAIEGNTLSEDEVLQHLEGKLQLPPSREYLAQEISNIVAGCNTIAGEIASRNQLDLSSARVKELNRIVLDKLPLDEGIVPGEIRRHNVTVARYRGAPNTDCEYLLERLCDWLSSSEFDLPYANTRVGTAILKAVLAHLYLAWIHPFGDGNGRTARLMEFQILISSGVPAPAAHLLSNHYNQTRTEYYRRLDQASRSGGDIVPFIMYAVRGLVDGLRSQLAVIKEQQWNVAWENYVHNCFKESSGPNHDRRKHLVLDLSNLPHPVPLAKLPEISLRLATAYAGRTKRTLARDVNALLKMNLLKREPSGISAQKELILAFLPIKAETAVAPS